MDSYFNLSRESDEIASSQGGDYDKFQDDLLEILEEERLFIARWQKSFKLPPKLFDEDKPHTPLLSHIESLHACYDY